MAVFLIFPHDTASSGLAPESLTQQSLTHIPWLVWLSSLSFPTIGFVWSGSRITDTTITHSHTLAGVAVFLIFPHDTASSGLTPESLTQQSLTHSHTLAGVAVFFIFPHDTASSGLTPESLTQQSLTHSHTLDGVSVFLIFPHDTASSGLTPESLTQQSLTHIPWLVWLSSLSFPTIRLHLVWLQNHCHQTQMLC